MKVWKFCPGYVNIWIMGKYPERFVNRCSEAGVRLSDLDRRKDGLRARIKASDFKRLRPIARGCGLRVRVLSRHGVPRIVSRIRRSAVFLTALSLFAAAVIFASGRLWFIGIETTSIPEETITGRLGELGVKRGASLSNISANAISRALESEAGVVNAKVVLRGVTLSVVITETNADAPGEKAEASAGVYADRDCVIRFIAVSKGSAVVREGAAVKKGELLISGDVSGVGQGPFLGADGLILGEVSRTVTATAQRTVIRSVPCGESEVVIAAALFGRELLIGCPFEEYELTLAGEKGFDASPLPLGIKKYLCREKKLTPITDSYEGTETRARLMAQEKLSAVLPRDAKIISIVTRCSLGQDGSVTAVITVTTVEKIGSRGETDGK